MTATLLAIAAAILTGMFGGVVLERWRNRHERAIDRAARFVADMLSGQCWTNDPDGNFTSMSPGLLGFFGVDPSYFRNSRRTAESEAAYRELERAFVHPDDCDAAAAKWRHCLATGVPYLNNHRLKRADGVYRWHRVVAIPARNARGRIVAWFGIGFDIDDEKRYEVALAQRERELQCLIDTVPVQIWRASAEGEPRYFNDRLCRFVGVSPGDFLAGSTRLSAINRALIHSDDLADAEADLVRSLRTGAPFNRRFRIRRADGVYRWSEHRAEPLRDTDGKILEWYGICLDIDEIKQAEDALRRSEHAYRELIDTLPAMVWSIRTYDGPTFFNRTLLDYTGYDPNSAERNDLATAVAVLVHPDDYLALREMHDRDFRSGVPVVHRFRVRRADGVYRWVEGRSASGRDESGAITGRYGILIDVEDEVNSVVVLRRRERELRDLVDTIPAMIFASPAPTGPLFMSKYYVDYTGYTVENFLAPGGTDPARVLRELIHPDDAERVARQYVEHFAKGMPLTQRYRVRRRDDAFRWVESRCASMHDDSGTPIGRYGILVDIDDEVQSQRALRETKDRLSRAAQAASLSELSASIAHEVNQPLAAVIANAQACQNWLAGDPPNLERARLTATRVIDDANAAADVIARIRALFKQTPTLRSDVAINAIISEVCDLVVEEAACKSLCLVRDLSPEIPRLRIDRVQIQQVLLNLIRNAIEATPASAGSTILIHSRWAGGEVIVEIADQGHGMADAEHAFEPFFTTKANGMGMGLAISRSIIEAHHGRLFARSNKPRGTTVAFALPGDLADTPVARGATQAASC